MLLQAVLQQAWAEMPAAVLESPLTSDRHPDLPSRRASSAVFRQLLPRRTALHPATNLIKNHLMWNVDVKPEVAAEVVDVLTRHQAELEETARMFGLLPRLAADEGIRLPPVGEEAFFRLAYRAAARQLSGCPTDGAALRVLLGQRSGNDGKADDRTSGSLYSEVLAAVTDPPFRATLQHVLEAGRGERETWRAPTFVPEVWDGLCTALASLLDFPADRCLIELDTRPRWDAVLDAGAHRWGLRHGPARTVMLGERVPNSLPPPLDRTVTERLGSLLGRGTDGAKLRAARRTASDLLLETATRTSAPLGLRKPTSRTVMALGFFAADLLQPEAPEEVTARYGAAAARFGTEVSRAFRSMRRLLEYYEPQKPRGGGDDGVGAREGNLDDRSEASAADFLTARAAADALRTLMSEEASHHLAAAVWKTVHRNEVFALEPLTVAAAEKLVRQRAAHVSSSMARTHREHVASDLKRARLHNDILAILQRLPPDDQMTIATTRASVPHVVEARLKEANEAVRNQNPTAEWISVATVRAFLRGPSGNG